MKIEEEDEERKKKIFMEAASFHQSYQVNPSRTGKLYDPDENVCRKLEQVSV